MSLSRRQFVERSAAAIAAVALSHGIGSGVACAATDFSVGYTLPKLPYEYDALMPHIDAETMKIHHDKHHAAYIANLNKALEPHPDLLKKDPVELISAVDQLPPDIRQAVINNGGGHVNHSLFWKMMAPNAGGAPKGELGTAITAAFGSFETFQTAFTDAAMKRFGSGWAWLVLQKDGKLAIASTANQDSPFTEGHNPILGIDVWEHAYYLKYQNRRPDYIKAWWNVVSWEFVAARYGR